MSDVVTQGRQVLDSVDTVRVFPLPGVVLFPHVLLPLHIFEPRYRQLTADALGADRLIAVPSIVTDLREGAVDDGIAAIAGAGVIEAAARLPDGRYVLRLRGIARIEVLRFVREKPYRIARFRRLEDRHEEDGPAVAAEKHQLLALCAGLKHEVAGSPGRVSPIDDSISFVTAVNTLCQTLNLDLSVKLRLLGMDDVRERCRMLTGLLTKHWEQVVRKRSGEGASMDDVH